MRTDTLQFKTANEAPAKSPRFVVAILFDTASLYITSHSGIANVPGTVLNKALKAPSAISQRIVPDEGRSEIGTFSFDVVDLASAFTDEVRTKLNAGAGLRGRKVQLWVGYKGFDFSAFQLFQTQIVSDCTFESGIYTVSCVDITRQQRTTLFDVKTTTLVSTMSVTDTTANVADTTQFLSVAHGSAWSDAPSATRYYFRIDQEVIGATGKTATTFTGCLRGLFNTAAAAHTVDPAAAQERRPKVEEFMYLDLPAPKMALAIQIGAILNGWPANLLGSDGSMQTDSNADGAANGWAKFVGGAGDGGRVYTASLVAGSSPFSGNAQRLINTTVGNSNPSGMFWSGVCRAGLRFTATAYIRTNVSSKVVLAFSFRNAAGTEIASSASATVVGDSIAHLAQITATAPALTESVRIEVRGTTANTEFFEFDSVMVELGSVVHALVTTPIEGLLPQHWHAGIDADFLRFDDFTGIGTDLWDLTDDSKGFTVRFEGLVRKDGKQMLEKEIYLLLGSYSPIYSDGTLGLKRLPAMISDAAPVATLTEREVISVSALQHDYASLHNQIRVTWSYDVGVGRFTRDSYFIDSQSVSIHELAPIIAYEFRGLHSGIHTDVMIRVRLDAVRDAYSYPPQRISVTVLPSLNRFETGDVLKIAIKNVRDFAGATTNISRSFVILRRSIDFISGEISLELFGSTLRPDAAPPSVEATAPLPDAYYTSQGVALSTVVAMTGNSVNVGSHSITGNASLLAAGAIVYHNGDLVVPNGANITISANVQLRVKGFITLNGTINGVGTGIAGTSDPGTPPITSPINGTSGFIGNSRGWDGIDTYSLTNRPPLMAMRTIPVALVKGKYEAWPALNLEVLGNALVGLPSDIRGGGGAPGGRTILSYSSNQTAAGGAGGNGGAGLAIICRGMSFGVSSQINLSGANTSNPAVTAVPLIDTYPGAGGAGAPGACLIVLDGNNILFPNAAGRVLLKTGTLTQQGFPLVARQQSWAAGNLTMNPLRTPWAGYRDEAVVSDADLSVAALRIQYVPFTQTPQDDQNRLPPALSDLSVTPGAGTNTIRTTLPAADSFDLVEYYAALTNNRAGAVLVARGRISEFTHDLPVIATRYYWARTSRTNAVGKEFFSDWFPVSATAGVVGTSLNPGGWTPITTQAGGATMIATASTLEKSGGTTAFDSQAYSVESYTACAVSWRAADATHDFMIALNTDPATDANYTSLDFAWELTAFGTLFIYEGGSVQSFSGTSTYDATTVFSITYDGENFRYFRNGILARTVNAPGLVVFLDSSFYSPGAKAIDVKFNSQPRATPANRFVTGGTATYVGSSIVKLTGSNAWDAETYSTDGYSEGAFASASAGNTTALMMFGLNSDPTTNASYTSLDYAWYLQSGSAQIYESNTSIGSFGTYTTATLLSVRHTGRLIQYIKDGVVVRSVPRVATTPLFFDSSLYSAGTAKLVDVQFGPAGLGAEADPSAVYLETFERPWETTFANFGNSGSLVTTYPNNGQFGGKVIRAQNQLYIESNENIPFDSTALYRITTRIRRISSGSPNEKVLCGVFCYAQDGVSHTSVFNQWNCANAFDMSAIAINTWQDFVGYFKGLGSNYGVAPNVDSSTTLDTGTAFFRPALVMNYPSGSGTMECDFIKVERLITPDNADNTDRQRVAPDSEFDRSSTLGVYWMRCSPAGGTTNIAPVLSITGGAIGGKVALNGSASLPNSAAVASRRQPAIQCVPGQMYTVQFRWRRTSAGYGSGTLRGRLVRHQQNPAASTVFGISSADVADCLGGLYITQPEILAATQNVWQEAAALIMVPYTSAFAGGTSPYIALVVQQENAGSGNNTEVDFAQVVAGVACAPRDLIIAGNATYGLDFSQLLRNVIHNNTVACTYELPAASADLLGAKFYFEQRNTGLMSISPASGDTLLAAPNLSGTRSMTGRYARAFAECKSATTWLITGQVV